MTSSIRTSKANYFSEAIKSGNNVGELWKYLKDINSVSKCHIKCINIDGKKCDHIEDICNNFNNHFSSVAERIINNSSCGTVALNGLWSLASFLIFADHRAYGFHPIKNFRNCAVKILRRFFANFCHEIECENDQTYIFRFVKYLSTFFYTYLPVDIPFFSKQNILIPNGAEKNILILVEEKKNILIQSFCHIT